MSRLRRLLAWLAGPAFACALAACSGAKSPGLDLRSPATMRAVLTVEAQAVLEADTLCASVARAMESEAALVGSPDRLKQAADLNRECTAVAEAAREALLAGQSILDEYEAGLDGRIGCAAAAGVEALRHMRDVLGRVSKKPLPPAVDQAIDAAGLLVSVLGGECPVGSRDAGSGDTGAEQ